MPSARESEIIDSKMFTSGRLIKGVMSLGSDGLPVQLAQTCVVRKPENTLAHERERVGGERGRACHVSRPIPERRGTGHTKTEILPC